MKNQKDNLSDKLMFREWIYIISAIIIMFGFIVGIIQLLLKIKKKIVKIILISTFIMLFLISTSIIYFFGAFGYTPEHVVEKDGQKFVAYVSGFKRTYVNYQDYKNIFVVENQKRIEEYYGKGGFDTIENKYGYEYNVERTTYYDENGKIISVSGYFCAVWLGITLKLNIAQGFLLPDVHVIVSEYPAFYFINACFVY